MAFLGFKYTFFKIFDGFILIEWNLVHWINFFFLKKGVISCQKKIKNGNMS
jgi:hypothetical protein